MECGDIYESDENESDGTLIDDAVENVYSVERHSENKSTSKNGAQQNINLDEVKTPGQVLNADVPEFIPRNFKVDVNNSSVINNSPLNSTPETKMSSTVENKEPSEIDKNTAQSSECQAEGCQTIVTKTTKEFLQTNITSCNVFTQTLEQIQEISKCEQQIEVNDQFFKTCITSVMEENTKLQEKVENLNKENRNALEEYKKQFLQDQQKILVLENSAHIASIKSEAHIERLQSKIDQLEAKVEALENTTGNLKKNCQIMQSIITTQSLQLFSLQERVLTEYLNNCRKMVFDVTSVLSYVSVNSIPTIADCHCHIKEWQQQLEKADLYLALLKVSYQQVTKDISLGNFTKISNLPEYYIKLPQHNDILHDSFIPAMNTLHKENWVYYQRNMQCQQQHSQWWKPASSTLNGDNISVVMTSPNLNFKFTTDNHGASKTSKIAELCQTDVISNWWQSSKDCIISEPSTLNNNFAIDNPETIQKYENKVNDLLFMPLSSNVAKETSKSSTSKETSDEVNDAKINTTGSSNTSNLEQTLTADYADLCIDKKCNMSEEKPAINPFSIACTKNVLQSSTLKKDVQDTRSNDVSRIYALPRTSANHSLKQTSSSDNASSFIIQDNSGNNSAVAINVDNSEPQNIHSKQEEHSEDEVYYFEGTSNNSESKKKQPFSFSLTKDCESTILSNNCTMNDSNTGASACQLTQEISTTTKEMPLSVDYSHLPEAVKKAGRSFCDLYLYVIERVPEKNESEIFAALKKVRRKNTKLSGMSKTTIVAAVRIELKIDQKSDGYVDKLASASAVIESEATELNKNNKPIMCTICIEPFGAIPLAKLPCGHAFHKKCIRQWFIYKSDCPVCRIFVIY